MQITIEQAIAAQASSIFVTKLPAATSYKFAKLAVLLQKELAIYEETRRKLIEDCGGVLSEDKMQYTFDKDAQDKFNAEFPALLSTTIDIGGHFPIMMSALGAVELSPLDLMRVEALLSDEPAQ
jgi:hypothetical protein